MRPLLVVGYAFCVVVMDAVKGVLLNKELRIDCPFKEFSDCVDKTYAEYLLYGGVYFRNCGGRCQEVNEGVQIGTLAPRYITFVFIAWVAFFLLGLVVYFITKGPEYGKGSYINFTQMVYGTKVYRVAVWITILLTICLISFGIYTITQTKGEPANYLIMFALCLIEVTALATLKEDSFNTSSITFQKILIRGRIPHCRQKSILKYPTLVFEFLLVNNATVLDWIEVQVMREALPQELSHKIDINVNDYSQWPLDNATVMKLVGKENRAEKEAENEAYSV